MGSCFFRYAVVTGGNKGIGFETCRQLALNGFTVVLTSRDEKRGLEAVDKLKESGLNWPCGFSSAWCHWPCKYCFPSRFHQSHFWKTWYLGIILIQLLGIFSVYIYWFVLDLLQISSKPDLVYIYSNLFSYHDCMMTWHGPKMWIFSPSLIFIEVSANFFIIIVGGCL